jgi:hypothetical protein
MLHQRDDFLQQHPRVQQLRMAGAFAAEQLQMADDFRPVLRGRPGVADERQAIRRHRGAGFGQIQIGQDGGEVIVEVVDDSVDDRPQTLSLLGAQQPFAQHKLLGRLAKAQKKGGRLGTSQRGNIRFHRRCFRLGASPAHANPPRTPGFPLAVFLQELRRVPADAQSGQRLPHGLLPRQAKEILGGKVEPRNAALLDDDQGIFNRIKGGGLKEAVFPGRVRRRGLQLCMPQGFRQKRVGHGLQGQPPCRVRRSGGISKRKMSASLVFGVLPRLLGRLAQGRRQQFPPGTVGGQSCGNLE